MTTATVDRAQPGPVNMLIGGRWESEPFDPLRPCVQPVDRPRDRHRSVLHDQRRRQGRAGGRGGTPCLGRDAGRRTGTGDVPVS